MYTDAPIFKTETLLLGQFLAILLKRIGNSRELIVSEIGADTGGTSKHVIETLVKLGYRFFYTFTDYVAFVERFRGPILGSAEHSH